MAMTLTAEMKTPTTTTSASLWNHGDVMRLMRTVLLMLAISRTLSPGKVSGLDLQRTNFGVVLKDQGQLRPSTSFWYHHFVVELPKLDDIIPAKCLKYLDGKVPKKKRTTTKCLAYNQDSGNGIGTLLINMNRQLVQEFRQLSLTARRNLPKLPAVSSRKRRAAPLSLIGDLSKSIFGTATQEDLDHVARKVNALISRGNAIGKTLAQHERNFETYMELANHRIADLKDIVTDNHFAIDEMRNETWLMLQETQALNQANTEAIRRLNATEYLTMHLRELSQEFRAMSRGVFPQLLITDKLIRKAAKKIGKLLRKLFPDYSLLHSEPDYFHKHGSFVAHLSGKSEIWITLKFPVGIASAGSKLYRVDSYPVPVSNGTTDATQITGLPDYVVIQTVQDGMVKYATMTQGQVVECRTKVSELICNFGLKFVDVRKDTCMSSLIQDNATNIHSFCEFLFYRDHIKPGFTPIADDTLILYEVDKLTLQCANGNVYTETGCTFCLFHIPCSCEVSFGESSYGRAADQACANVTAEVTRRHLVNLAVLREFELDMINGLNASTHLKAPLYPELPKIEFYDHDFKQFVAQDNKTAFNLKKVAQAAKNNEKIFETLSDPILMGTLDVPNAFTWDNYLLFIVVSLTVIACVFNFVHARRRGREYQDQIKKLQETVFSLSVIVKAGDAKFLHDELFEFTTVKPIDNGTQTVEQAMPNENSIAYTWVYVLVFLAAVPALFKFVSLVYRVGPVLFRFCCRRRLGIDIVLHLVSSDKLSEYLTVATVPGPVGNVSARTKDSNGIISVRVFICFVYITWGRVALVETRDYETTRQRVLKSRVFVNPIKAYRIWEYLRNTDSTIVPFVLYVKEQGIAFRMAEQEVVSTDPPPCAQAKMTRECETQTETVSAIPKRPNEVGAIPKRPNEAKSSKKVNFEDSLKDKKGISSKHKSVNLYPRLPPTAPPAVPSRTDSLTLLSYRNRGDGSSVRDLCVPNPVPDSMNYLSNYSGTDPSTADDSTTVNDSLLRPPTEYSLSTYHDQSSIPSNLNLTSGFFSDESTRHDESRL